MNNINGVLDTDYHYKRSDDKVPFTISDFTSKYNGLRCEMVWGKIKMGCSWNFRHVIQEDKDKYVRIKCNGIGLNPLEYYKNFDAPFLFEVINSKNKYLIGLKGKTTLDNLEKHNGWDTRSLLPEEFKKYVNRVCSDLKYKVIKYPQNIKDKVTVITGTGCKWSCIFDSLARGTRCPFDAQISFGERTLCELFKLNNINFEYQKKIKCANKANQRMDVYLPDYNMCIEYNGSQHYEKTNWSTLDYQNQQDLKKYKYCKENNIKYCEIPFIYDSIEEITKYVEDKILHKKLKTPDSLKVQYSQLYNDEQLIALYKKYKSADEAVKYCHVTSVTILRVLKRHNIDTYSLLRPVVQLTKSNELIKIYESIHQPERFMDVSHQNIWKICNGYYGSKTAKGFKWMYLSDYLSSHPLSPQEIDEYMVS